MFFRKPRSSQRPQVDLRWVDPNFLRQKHRNADWSGRRFDTFVAVGCVFDSCLFEGCAFQQACFGGGLEDSRYVNCSFDRSTIRAIAPGNARFESCSFMNVEIIDMLCHSIELVNCRFSGVIRRAFFNGEVLGDHAPDLGRTRNAFEGNDFADARFVDVAFRTGIDLSKQKLPTGWRNET